MLRTTYKQTDKQTDSKILPTPTDIVGVCNYVLAYLFKGYQEYVVWMVKSFAAAEKGEVVAERSDHDRDALQRHVLKQSRLLESVHVIRVQQRSFLLRQEATQTNIESTIIESTVNFEKNVMPDLLLI